LLLSDLHWGEVVRAEEIGGANEYDMAVAQSRLRNVIQTTIELLREHVVGDYPGIVVPLGGDMISCSIHDELQQTNDLQRMEFEKWKAELEASTRILVAQLSAQQVVAPEVGAAAADNVVDAVGDPLLDMHRETLAGIQQLVAAMARPKTIVRGPDGRAVGLT
jgi:hypothetical protein